jgi:hypothetical protein
LVAVSPPTKPRNRTKPNHRMTSRIQRSGSDSPGITSPRRPTRPPASSPQDPSKQHTPRRSSSPSRLHSSTCILTLTLAAAQAGGGGAAAATARWCEEGGARQQLPEHLQLGDEEAVHAGGCGRRRAGAARRRQRRAARHRARARGRVCAALSSGGSV